ncbi:NAD(P)/FAD-dependent oxidoreductase, partial [Megasphaera sp. NM10]|uniref:NAD(P)/FAD-dependent oxidoreductase n=1 Tax=Megasphaera sp. NM10 TaxID=1273103 RepID=UPI000357E2E2
CVFPCSCASTSNRLCPRKSSTPGCGGISRIHPQRSRQWLKDLLPQRLIPIVLDQAGIAAACPVNQISREQRQDLVDTLKALSLTVTGTRPIEEAIVTAGGIAVKEINPKMMESKLVPNLYFAGEVIDIDAFTGGYNLQAAFSTGFVAGTAAATKECIPCEN